MKKKYLVGFMGPDARMRESIASALVRELRVSSKVACQVSLRFPVHLFLGKLDRDYLPVIAPVAYCFGGKLMNVQAQLQLEEKVKEIFGKDVLHKRVDRDIALMDAARIFVVEDLQEPEDVDWFLGHEHAFLVKVTPAGYKAPADQPDLFKAPTQANLVAESVDHRSVHLAVGDVLEKMLTWLGTVDD